MKLYDDSTNATWGPLHRKCYHGDYASILARNLSAYSGGKAQGVESQTLFRFDPKDKSLCDIGAGGGWDAAACIGAGGTVCCLEVDQTLIDMGVRSFREIGIEPCRYRWVNVVGSYDDLPKFDIVYSRAVFMHLPIELVIAYWQWTAQHLTASGEAHFQLYQSDGKTTFCCPFKDYVILDSEAEAILQSCGLSIVDRREIRRLDMEPVWTMYILKKSESL